MFYLIVSSVNQTPQQKKHNINYFCEVSTEIWTLNLDERGREEKGKYIYFPSAKQHIWKGNSTAKSQA